MSPSRLHFMSLRDSQSMRVTPQGEIHTGLIVYLGSSSDRGDATWLTWENTCTFNKVTTPE